MKITAFWHVTQCRLAHIYVLLRMTLCRHLQAAPLPSRLRQDFSLKPRQQQITPPQKRAFFRVNKVGVRITNSEGA
jgi:hypothetical protein